MVIRRTLPRRIRKGSISSVKLANAAWLARVVERAAEAFENLDTALDWMNSPNSALAGATPLSLMNTDVGAENVMDTLGRIEHGVFD